MIDDELVLVRHCAFCCIGGALVFIIHIVVARVTVVFSMLGGRRELRTVQYRHERTRLRELARPFGHTLTMISAAHSAHLTYRSTGYCATLARTLAAPSVRAASGRWFSHARRHAQGTRSESAGGLRAWRRHLRPQLVRSSRRSGSLLLPGAGFDAARLRPVARPFHEKVRLFPGRAPWEHRVDGEHH